MTKSSGPHVLENAKNESQINADLNETSQSHDKTHVLLLFSVYGALLENKLVNL